mmetsp:Transcript_168455/g.541311  ORF Transcript_168455/g.541311 Transcript_168455/m.541311 type:complete len:1401 (-) Transcript_168455:69-4271(-)
MAVTSFDGQFSFKQDSLARLGPRERSSMNADQQKAFQNSPFMQGVRKCEDLCFKFTCSRDEERAKRDPSFKPDDEDFNAPKAHTFERGVNYYKVLGIDEYSALDEVKKAYKKLSLVYHPDKTAGLSAEQKEEYAGIFMELKNAYLTLGDQATRRQYDRDRDRDKASFEINGFKPKVRSHFDATEMLKKLQEMQKPPGKIIDVQISVKLEKFLYGGHKKITRMRRVKDFGGFTMQQHLFRVDIPRGASAPHECIFKRKGDHNENTSPDTVNFKISCKPHDVVDWRGDDLVCRSPIYLGSRALREPFLSTQASSVRGRQLLLWGRNPFVHERGTTGANLRVRVLGAGMTQDGALELTCRLGTAPTSSTAQPSRPVSGSAGGYPSATPSSSSTSKPADSGWDKVVVTVRHLQTEAKMWVRVPRTATMADIRAKITTAAGLPRGSTVRLLQQIAGGFTPYPDRQTLGGLTMLNCAGTAWNGVTMTPEKTSQMLQRLSEAMDTAAFQMQLASTKEALRESSFVGQKAKADVLVRLAEVLPDFGLEASAEALAEGLAAARRGDGGGPSQEQQALLDKVLAIERLGEVGSSALGPRGVRPMKRFVLRHGLGPPGGFDFQSPGSETELELVPGNPGESVGGSSSSRSARHGQGGLCEAPAMQRRVARSEAAERSCDAELAQVGEPMTLFTRPTCRVTFFSNMHQAVDGPGRLAHQPLFGMLLSTSACVKKAGVKEWDQLRLKLVPVLQATGFHFLKAARAVLPRTLACARACWEYGPPVDEAADTEFVTENDAALDLWACSQRLHEQPVSTDGEALRERCEQARGERRAFLRRHSAIMRREAVVAQLAPPWKHIGDASFKHGDFFTAASCYTRALDDLRPDGRPEAEVDRAAVAVALSNRAACLAKVRLWEESLSDARAALDSRPNWGRAWSRIGHAAAALGRVQEAVDAYLEAVTFEPSGANVQALSDIVACRGANAEDAHKTKEVGNGAMRTGEHGLAVAQYTYCLALLPPVSKGLNPNNPSDEHAFLRSILHANRSAAFSRLKNWPLALADARSAVASKGDFAKAQTRLGTALLGHSLTEQAYAAFARALQIEANDAVAAKGRQTCLSMLPLWSSCAARKRMRDRFRADLGRPSGSTKVYAISDIHYDHKCNEEWAHEIDSFAFQEDVLIVAGNLCDTRNGLQRALSTLKSKFRRVFYVPGNHEFWVHPSEATKFPDSFAKFLNILELCDELGVDVFPAAVAQDVFVVPLNSWYSADFDEDDPFPDPNSKTDQHCRWPIPDTQIWRYMMRLNRAHVEHLYHGCVLSFSHFLPKQTLPHFAHGGLPKTTGCEALDEQVRALKGSRRVHVYGHAHRHHSEWDGGVLYVNHYHGEEGGKNDRASLMLIYDGKEVCRTPKETRDGAPRF